MTPTGEFEHHQIRPRLWPCFHARFPRPKRGPQVTTRDIGTEIQLKGWFLAHSPHPAKLADWGIPHIFQTKLPLKAFLVRVDESLVIVVLPEISVQARWIPVTFDPSLPTEERTRRLREENAGSLSRRPPGPLDVVLQSQPFTTYHG